MFSLLTAYKSMRWKSAHSYNLMCVYDYVYLLMKSSSFDVAQFKVRFVYFQTIQKNKQDLCVSNDV